jgi:hypothetical protein
LALSFRFLSLLALAVLGSLAACDADGGDTVAGLGTPAGGTLEVRTGPLAGLALTVPAGALPTGRGVSIRPSASTPMAGLVAVGPAAELQPATVRLSRAATLILPFDAGAVSGSGAQSLRVARRDGAGRLEILVPTAVDPAAGRATVPIEGLGTFWAVVPASSAAAPLSDYFPLGDLDAYVFADGAALGITPIEGIGPVPIPLTAIELFTDGRRVGYLTERNADGSFARHGRFASAAGGELVEVTEAAPLLARRVGDGQRVEAQLSYTSYRLGPPDPVATGSVVYAVELRRADPVVLGQERFDDVLELTIRDTFADDPPSSRTGTATLRLWLGRGLGPVRYQVDDGAAQDLFKAIVGRRVFVFG